MATSIHANKQLTYKTKYSPELTESTPLYSSCWPVLLQWPYKEIGHMIVIAGTLLGYITTGPSKPYTSRNTLLPVSFCVKKSPWAKLALSGTSFQLVNCLLWSCFNLVFTFQILWRQSFQHCCRHATKVIFMTPAPVSTGISVIKNLGPTVSWERRKKGSKGYQTGLLQSVIQKI